MVDEARWRLNRRFRTNPADKTIVVIYSETTFRSLMGGEFGNLEGFFSAEDGKLRIAVRDGALGDIRSLRPLILHEYVHRLIHYITHGRLRTRWLHEGLATYYERAESGVDRYALLSPSLTRSVSGSPIRLNELLKEKITIAGYLKARRVVEFLIGRYGEPRMLRLLREMGSGKSLAVATKNALGISYEKLEELVYNEVR